ncbi:MAG: hypothetical protein NC254_08355 [bacterium]|nr:hypothetical protein [bacterium]
MSNKKWYQETFDKVHVPGELLGKVMDMENQTEKKAKKGWRYAMGTLAAAVGLFVASNGICYAATGETWVSRMTIYLNGEKIEKDVTWQENEDGTYLGTVNVGSDEEVGLFAVADDAGITGDLSASLDDDGTVGELSVFFDGEEIEFGAEDVYAIVECEVETKEDGSIWLRVMENGNCKAEVDLTEDLADGMAEGDIVYDELLTYHYQVTQTADGEYDLTLLAQFEQE